MGVCVIHLKAIDSSEWLKIKEPMNHEKAGIYSAPLIAFIFFIAIIQCKTQREKKTVGKISREQVKTPIERTLAGQMTSYNKANKTTLEKWNSLLKIAHTTLLNELQNNRPYVKCRSHPHR